MTQTHISERTYTSRARARQGAIAMFWSLAVAASGSLVAEETPGSPSLQLAQQAAPAAAEPRSTGTSGRLEPRFEADGAKGFTFDTGVMRGRLRADGKSLGLTDVYHVGTGRRIDAGHGLLGHYRVFTKGVRYGGGAWDWPSTATLVDPRTVEVLWPAADQRPFTLRAVYRLAKPSTIEVETTVEPREELTAFEVFLASYFDRAFTNAVVLARVGEQADLVEATPERGDWQMYARDDAARALILDGRWRLEPNPVAWTFPFPFAGPVAMVQRRAEGAGVSAMLSAPATDCFAIALPQQTEGHYSLYLSLFGRTIPAGETVRTRAQLVVGKLPAR